MFVAPDVSHQQFASRPAHNGYQHFTIQHGLNYGGRHPYSSTCAASEEPINVRLDDGIPTANSQAEAEWIVLPFNVSYALLTLFSL